METVSVNSFQVTIVNSKNVIGKWFEVATTREILPKTGDLSLFLYTEERVCGGENLAIQEKGVKR